jgi:hypothetical protein
VATPLSQYTLATPDGPLTDGLLTDGLDRVRPGAGMRILVLDQGQWPVGIVTGHDIHRLAQQHARDGDVPA